MRKLKGLIRECPCRGRSVAGIHPSDGWVGWHGRALREVDSVNGWCSCGIVANGPRKNVGWTQLCLVPLWGNVCVRSLWGPSQRERPSSSGTHVGVRKKVSASVVSCAVHVEGLERASWPSVLTRGTYLVRRLCPPSLPQEGRERGDARK